MPRHKIGNDRTTTWSIEGDDQNWLLKPKGSITTELVPALIVTSGSDENRVKLLGDVVTDGAGAMAVILRGVDTKLTLGPKGSIEASMGIHNLAVGNDIIIKGDVFALNAGIRSTAEVSIKVSGDIFGGHHGIELEGDIAGSRIRIEEKGSISGSNAGISIADGTDVTIINDGKLRSDLNAIVVDTGDVTIFNRGKVSGDIETGSGNDKIDLRGGSITGEVRGGAGGDSYWISDADTVIVEDALGDYDVVASTVSFSLYENVEMAVLLGKRDINVTGNGSDNILIGSNGDNVLDGGAGEDMIGGLGGRDRLTGGADIDTFIFQPGAGRDTITDFTNGEDTMRIWNYASIGTFADLESRMTQEGANVRIQLEGKDRITLENVSLLDLDEADFWVDDSVS